MPLSKSVENHGTRKQFSLLARPLGRRSCALPGLPEFVLGKSTIKGTYFSRVIPDLSPSLALDRIHDDRTFYVHTFV